MEKFNIFSLLSYGAIGLGCILAVLAYRLLRREQDTKTPRKQILTSIYVFMAFSLALSALGFVGEFFKDSADTESSNQLESKVSELEKAEVKWKENIKSEEGTITELTNQLNDKETRLATLQEQFNEFRTLLAKSHGELGKLMEQKTGKLTKLQELDASDPSFKSLFEAFADDLRNFDESMKTTINALDLPSS